MKNNDPQYELSDGVVAILVTCKSRMSVISVGCDNISMLYEQIMCDICGLWKYY